MTDILLTEEEIRFRDELRAFIAGEIDPGLVERMDKEHEEYPYEFIRKMGRGGYLGVSFPQEYGGRGLNFVCEMLASEEAGYTKKYAVERYLRDVRVIMIYNGPSEIMREIIQRQVFRQMAE